MLRLRELRTIYAKGEKYVVRAITDDCIGVRGNVIKELLACVITACIPLACCDAMVLRAAARVGSTACK